MSRSRTDQAGATRDEESRARRKPWWLLALLALAVLLFALSQCGNGNDPRPTAPAPTPVATAASAPTAAANVPTAAAPSAPVGAGVDAGQSTLTAGGVALLPLAQSAGANAELTSRVGQSVTARGAVVESVPADEGFWVGTSATDRVWVQLTGEAGESGYTVQPGDRVDFTGQMVANDAGTAAQAGIDPAGAELLTRQGAHIEVAKPDLRGASA